MKYLSAVLFMIFFNHSFAQVQMAFITKDGKYSANRKHAVSYVVIKKMDGDSAFSVIQYDIRDTFMVSGFYKDSLLTIPHGKFIFYQKNSGLNFAGRRLSGPHIDTNSFVKQTGYFVNGKREGIWLEYSSRGKIAGEYTYENDKLNGPFKNYNNGKKGSWGEGTMLNDSTEGKFLVYGADSLLLSEVDYLHGKMVNRIVHYTPAKLPEGFYKFLESNLKKYRKQLMLDTPVIKYTIDKSGRIVNPQVLKSINPEVAAAIIATLAIAPHYTPANYDSAPREQEVEGKILLFHERNFVYYNNYGSYYGSNGGSYFGPHHPPMVYYLYGGTIVGAGALTH